MKTDKELISLYPWLHPVNVVSNKKIEFSSNEQPWTELFSLPKGWRIAFQDQMVSELDVLIKEANINDYVITIARQALGKLDWRDNFKSRNIRKELKEKYNNLIKKYTDMSSLVCIFCGKDVVKTSSSVYPTCGECQVERNHHEKKKKK
jgi:hypothetical protein